MDAEAQGDEVEPGISAPRAVPVDDAGDLAAQAQHVAGMEVLVNDIEPWHTFVALGPDRRDPAFEIGGTRAELPQRLVQAVARTVVAQLHDIRPSVSGNQADPAFVERP